MSLLNPLRRLKQRFIGRDQIKPESTRDIEYREWSSLNRDLALEVSLSGMNEVFPNLREVYRYSHHYHHHRSPEILREHRRYFREEKRGFGEDAFHAMWWLLFLEFKPCHCLEIGIYRGQVLSLWALIGKYLHLPTDLHGISPMSSAGDVISGDYLGNIDYEKDIRLNHQQFGLTCGTLLKAYSTDTIAVNKIKSREWDLIYIDGNHDLEVVKKDYEVCKEQLCSGGLLVLDDAAAYQPYDPPAFSFKGHPGPSELVRDIASKEMIMICSIGHNVIFRKP